MTLSLIGAGFGRTGTLSLKTALEQLGLGRCYHMMEVIRNPDHAPLWSAAASGEAVEWDALFAGYGATVDWPSTRFWRELADHYPDARILLSIRDPERWYESVSQTIYKAMTAPQNSDHSLISRQLSMAREIVLEQTFEGRFEDRAHAIGIFERHNEEVRRLTPPERLLVYEVGDGWEPLCAFLDRPVPDAAFPRVNTSEEFRERFSVVKE